MGQRNSREDTAEYRNHYPNQEQHSSWTKNKRFYTNQISSKPSGDYIDNIHTEWFGNHRLLEVHHGYIQWIFPIREQGLNSQADPLQLHEAADIIESEKVTPRVRKSYEMMLHFYGMKLVDVNTGEISREENWRERYAHLNRSFHNYLRITRILKSLGELGYEHYKLPFLKHVLVEIFEHGKLKNCARSALNYWVEVLRNEDEYKQLHDMINKYRGVEESSSEEEEAPQTTTTITTTTETTDDNDEMMYNSDDDTESVPEIDDVNEEKSDENGAKMMSVEEDTHIDGEGEKEQQQQHQDEGKAKKKKRKKIKNVTESVPNGDAHHSGESDNTTTDTHDSAQRVVRKKVKVKKKVI